MKIFRLFLIFSIVFCQSCIKIDSNKKKVFIFDFDKTMYDTNNKKSPVNDGSYLQIMYLNVINDLKNNNKDAYNYAISNNKSSHEYWIVAKELYNKFNVYPNQQNIDYTVNEMLKLQTNDLVDIIKKIKSMGHEVFIIGGDTLGCAIIPGFAKEFGVEKDHIYSGYFKDFDPESISKSFPHEWRYVNCTNPDLPTPKSLNKSKLIKDLKEQGIINGHVVHIGDGDNDLEVWKNGQADVFIGFGINKYRKKVEDGSKIYVKNMDQFKGEIDELLYIDKI